MDRFSFADYMLTAMDMYRENLDLRLGQALMGHLADVRPDLYSWITEHHPDVDPFYNNGRIGTFLEYIEGEW